MIGPFRTKGTPNPVARAVDVEVDRLAILRAKCIQAMAVGMVLAGVLVIVTGEAGRAGGVIALAVAVLMFVVGALARTDVAQRVGSLKHVLAALGVAAEMLSPFGFYGMIGYVGGAHAAATAWGPVFLFCGVLTMSVLRLQWRYTVALGVVGAVEYVALTLALGPDDVAVRTVGAGVAEQVAARAAFIVIASIIVAVVARGLRSAMGGVVSTVRAADLFGKYRLESKLAEGGMGVVWLATYCPEGGFARPAAVKLVHPHLAKDVEFVDGFRREAELGARLVHGNIVQTFDFGRVDDRYFLAMEYVDGITLRELLRRANAFHRPVPSVVAATIVRAVLAGLGYAHAQARDQTGALLRVIHRDLAPSNILIAKSGNVKVTDFGIARALRDRPAELTQTVAGHFDHMAPEQVDAMPLDERADLFCAGVLLWELLTGRMLFRRANEAATLRAVALDPIPMPSTVDAELKEWDPLLAKALSREPADRYATAHDMAEAIRMIAGDGGDDVVARFLSTLPDAAPEMAAPLSLPSKGDVDTSRTSTAAATVDERARV